MDDPGGDKGAKSGQVEALRALVGPIKSCATCTFWFGHCHSIWDFDTEYPCGRSEYGLSTDPPRYVTAEDCCDNWLSFKISST